MLPTAAGLARSCHPGPTLAVTALATGLGVRAGLDPARLALLAGAVFTGQLTIGWGNDLIDAARDRAVGRTDKPLAAGRLRVGTVRAAIGVAGALTLVLSSLLGVAAALVHVVLVVGSGWAYDLLLKRTRASFVPYALAFGALPAVPTLAAAEPAMPSGWMLCAGALLGIGAHAVNVLPDLDDDAATGVRGLPHALGERGLRVLAAGSLLAGCAAAVAGSGLRGAAAALVVLTALACTVVVARGRGRTPFVAAVIAALLVVAVLLVA